MRFAGSVRAKLAASCSRSSAPPTHDEVHGHLELTPGSQKGDCHVLVAGEVDDAYAAIQSACDVGSKQAMATSIPASALLAPDVDLTGNAIRR